MTDSIGKESNHRNGIPVRDLAKLFAEAAQRDPFANVKVVVGFRGQVKRVTITFPPGGGRAPEGTDDGGN